jgi:hypothetical protein
VQDLKGQRTGASSLHSTRQKETKVEVGLQKQDSRRNKRKTRFRMNQETYSGWKRKSS